MDSSTPNLVREDMDCNDPEKVIHRPMPYFHPRPLLLNPANTLAAFLYNMRLMNCNLSDVVFPVFCCLLVNGYVPDQSGLFVVLRLIEPHLTIEKFTEILEASSSRLNQVIQNKFRQTQGSAFKANSPSVHDPCSTTPGESEQTPLTEEIPTISGSKDVSQEIDSDGEKKDDDKQSSTENPNLMIREEFADFEMHTDRVLSTRSGSEVSAPLSSTVETGLVTNTDLMEPSTVRNFDLQQPIKQEPEEPLDEEFYEEVENETRHFARLRENAGSKKREHVCDENPESRKKYKYNFEVDDDEEDIQVTFYRCCELHKSNNCIRHLLKVRKELRWVSCDNCQKWYHCFCIYGRNTEYKAEEFFCCGNKKTQNKSFKRALTGIVRDTVISKREAAKNRGK